MGENQADISKLQFLTEAYIISEALQWYHDFLTQKMGPYKLNDFGDMMRLGEMRVSDSWQLLNGASDRLYNGGLLFAHDEHELFRLIFDNGLFMALNDALEAKNVTLERFVYELRDKGLLQKDDPDFITNEEAEFRLNCDVRRWLWAMKDKNQPQPTTPAADQQGAEPVKAGKAKRNTAKAAVYLFFDKHINDSNSRFFVLKESQGKGTYQKELADLHTLFMEEHSEIEIKADTFKKNYLNEWRQPPKK